MGEEKQNYIGKCLDLDKITEYQDGAVVSKTILTKKAGNISMFAFDKGEGLTEHTSPFDAFVQIIQGKAEIKINGEPYIANEGQIIIMPANQPHSLQAIDRFKMMLVMIRSKE